MTAPPTEGASEPLTSSTPYRSARALAAVLFVLLLLNATVDLFAILSSAAQFGMLNAAVEAGSFTVEQAEAKLTRDGLIAIVTLLVYLATVVVFCFWIHRAYANLAALGNPKSRLEYSPAWAVGYFFIPLLNLYVPYRVTSEIWRKSDPAVRTQDGFMFAAPSAAAFILVWWLCWIASNVLDRFHGKLYDNASTPDAALMVAKLELVARAVALTSAVLAAFVVHDITRRQEARSQHVVYTPHLPPPPPIFNPPPQTSPPTGGER
jgi:hypothetical protein